MDKTFVWQAFEALPKIRVDSTLNGNSPFSKFDRQVLTIITDDRSHLMPVKYLGTIIQAILSIFRSIDPLMLDVNH